MSRFLQSSASVYPPSSSTASTPSLLSYKLPQPQSRSCFGRLVAFARKLSQEGKKSRNYNVSATSKVYSTNRTSSKTSNQRDTALLPSVFSIQDELRLASTEQTAYHNGGVPTLNRRDLHASTSIRSFCQEEVRTVELNQLESQAEFPHSALGPGVAVKLRTKSPSTYLRHRYGLVTASPNKFFDLIRTTSPLPFSTSLSQSAVSAIGHALMDDGNWSPDTRSIQSPVKPGISQSVRSPTKSIIIPDSSTVDSIIAIINAYTRTGDRKVMSKSPSHVTMTIPHLGSPPQTFPSSVDHTESTTVTKIEPNADEIEDSMSIYSAESKSHHSDVEASDVGVLDQMAKLTNLHETYLPAGTTPVLSSRQVVSLKMPTPVLHLVPATPQLDQLDNTEETGNDYEDDSIIYDCYDLNNIAIAL